MLHETLKPSDAYARRVLREMELSLRPVHFRRRRASFCREHPDILHLIGFQRSQNSTRDRLIFSINIGVFSKLLAEKVGGPESPSSTWDCHWESRLGFLMPEETDRWWECSTDHDAEASAGEVIAAIADYALPLLEAIKSNDDMRRALESGQLSGLTITERKMYLDVLTG